MNISKSMVGDIAVIKLNGRLDLETSKTLKGLTKELMADNHNKMIFDLTDVDFINSSGLGTLVSILRDVNSKKGNLELCSLAPYIQEIFEITHLSSIFRIYENEEEALSSFAVTENKTE